jgi:hypothetical protein
VKKCSLGRRADVVAGRTIYAFDRRSTALRPAVRAVVDALRHAASAPDVGSGP